LWYTIVVVDFKKKGRENMLNVKEQILDAVNTLPENTTWEDAIYTLYIRRKVAMGLEAIEKGEVISHEDLRKEVETWK
jgi:predicted transcriptional regulator